VAKRKGESTGNETFAEAARAEKRLLRDEERALKRLDKARNRLIRAEEKMSRARDRVEQRQAAVNVAEDEYTAAQQARAEGPISQEKQAADAGEFQSPATDATQVTDAPMPPQGESLSSS
jgi:hypothetical protein